MPQAKLPAAYISTDLKDLNGSSNLGTSCLFNGSGGVFSEAVGNRNSNKKKPSQNGKRRDETRQNSRPLEDKTKQKKCENTRHDTQRGALGGMNSSASTWWRRQEKARATPRPFAQQESGNKNEAEGEKAQGKERPVIKSETKDFFILTGTGDCPRVHPALPRRTRITNCHCSPAGLCAVTDPIQAVIISRGRRGG